MLLLLLLYDRRRRAQYGNLMGISAFYTAIRPNVEYKYKYNIGIGIIDIIIIIIIIWTITKRFKKIKLLKRITTVVVFKMCIIIKSNMI